MADIYAPQSISIDPSGTAADPNVQAYTGNENIDSYLSSLPVEEREAALARLTAPLTGEELAQQVQQGYTPTIEEFDRIEEWHKSHEVSIIEGIGAGIDQVMTDLSRAVGAAVDHPFDVLSKSPANVVEAFAQGTRNLYGMAAQSADPTSTLFRFKDFLTGSGTKESRYQQYLDAVKFNRHSSELMEGKKTLVMDKDMINSEVVQAASYIADPTLFIPFGVAASAGLRAVGLGEKMAMIGAKSTAIKNALVGGTLKWGVGAPVEFLGGAVRNTIDYGIERGALAVEATTGLSAREIAQTARMSGLPMSAASFAGHSIPYAGAISEAYVTASAARGVGEAVSAIGDRMLENRVFGRGINSWARDALENTPNLSSHAKGLLRVLDAVDPMFTYTAAITEGAAQGSMIGGGLGYLSGGEEGLGQGLGAGMALGGVGGLAGKGVADVTNATLYDRVAIQRKIVIEGLKKIDPDKAVAFEALARTAEASGDRHYQAHIDGMIAGVDKVAPNSKWNIRSQSDHIKWLLNEGLDPTTGKLMEFRKLLPEFGSDRRARSRALGFLSQVGDRFAGKPQDLVAHLQTLPQDHALRKAFFRMSGEQKQAVMDTLTKHSDPEYIKQFKGKKAADFYGDINYSEINVARVNELFAAGDIAGAKKMIDTFLKDNTQKDGTLNERGQMLKNRLGTEGYFDKDGNLRPTRNTDVEATAREFASAEGFVLRRGSNGQIEVNINLSNLGKDGVAHELFHAIFKESVLRPDFIDRLSKELLGTFDKDGKMVKGGSVGKNEIREFFRRYVRLTQDSEQGFKDEMARIESAIKEFETGSEAKTISPDAIAILHQYTEEFGAYYFQNWLRAQSPDFLFKGGELTGIRGIMDGVKNGWLDFWESTFQSKDPKFRFGKIAEGKIDEGFKTENGKRIRVSSLDYFNRDFIRATADTNKGNFDINKLSANGQAEFVKANGIRNTHRVDQTGRAVRLSRREAAKSNAIAGKEIYKILKGISPNRPVDGDGNFIGRLTDAELDAIVKSGHANRAWANKIKMAYDILDGNQSNVVEFGYLGRTEQITDASYPRLYGEDVSFKHRKAILLDVEMKVGDNGTFHVLFHTLDKSVIEARGDNLWKDSAVQSLWDGNRGRMEQDFFRYLENASKPDHDQSKKPSHELWRDGKGGQRRDVLHQMLGMAKGEGDTYINKPIAEIPLGIRHSVTTFNNDGISSFRTSGTERYNYNHNNAYKLLSRNWKPSEMSSQKTPVGEILNHATGYKFVKDSKSQVRAFSSTGSKIGTFDSVEKAAKAGEKHFNDAMAQTEEAVRTEIKRQDGEARQYKPLSQEARAEAIVKGDVFLLQEMVDFVGKRTLLRQTRDEHIYQKALDAIENPEQLLQLLENEANRNKPIQEELKRLEDEIEIVSKKKQEAYKGYDELFQTKPPQDWTGADDVNHPDYKPWLKAKRELERQMGLLSNAEQKALLNRNLFEQKNKAELADNDAKNELETLRQYTTESTTREEVAKMLALRVKANVHQKDYSGLLEALFAREYDDQIQTGKPFVAVTTHGTKNVELMMNRLFLAEKLGTNFNIKSSNLGAFSGGSQNTSGSSNYTSRPPLLNQTLIGKIKRVADMGEEGVNLSNDIRFKLLGDLFKEFKRTSKENGVPDALFDKYKDAFLNMESTKILHKSDFEIKPWMSEELINLHKQLLQMDEPNVNKSLYPDKDMQLRKVIRMDNPYVVVDPRSYEEHFISPHMERAIAAGHDGIIFKRFADGGQRDNIYVVFKDYMKDNIKVLETSFDDDAVPRGKDASGRTLKGGKELGLQFKPVEWINRDLMNHPDNKATWDRIMASGSVVQGYNIKDLEGKSVLNISPDNSFVGEISVGDDLVMKGQGGVLFAVNNLEKGGIWASSDKAARKMYDMMTKLREADLAKGGDGTVYISIPVSKSSKVSSSENGARGYMNVINQLVKHDIVSKEILQTAIRKTIKSNEGILDSNGKPISLSGSGEQITERVLASFFSGDNKSFRARGTFVKNLVTEITKANIKDPNKLADAQKTFDTNAKNILTNSDVLFENIGKLFDDPLTKGLNEGDVYAVIKVSGEFGIESTRLHDSYDTTIVHKGGEKDKPQLLLLDKPRHITDLIDSVNNKEMVSEGKFISNEEFNQRLSQSTPRGKGFAPENEDGAQHHNAYYGINSSGQAVGKFKASLKPAEAGEEGGRVYTDAQFKNEFIGKVAAENPELTEGLSIDVKEKTFNTGGSFPADVKRFFLTITKNGELVGKFNSEVFKDKTAEVLNAEVESKFRRMGYGELIYSEMMERMRSIGRTSLEGNIVDSLARPQKIRTKLTGQEPDRQVWDERRQEYIWLSPNQETKWNYQEPTNRIRNKLDPNAHYKPAEYQGGDDYYKPKKNKFESRDEQGFLVRSATAKNAEGGTSYNPESVDWFDIGHYGGRETKELTRWENNNSGLWLFDKNSGIDTINPAEFESPDFTHAQWFAKKYPSNPTKSLPLGRYEKPRYGSDGELIEKGKISINSSAKSPIESMAEARKIKTALAEKFGFKEEDFDAYLFKANPEVKQSMGFSPKDQLPIKFKPAEAGEQGGRVYTQKQIDGEFIGRIASESPELKKGLKLYYGKVPQGMGTEGITLRDKNGDVVGNIKFERFGEDVSILQSDVYTGYQGKGYGNLLYSELVERLRSEGVKTVDGWITDKNGRPQKIRKRVIDTQNAKVGGEKTKVLAESGGGRDVTSYLKKEAYYKPAEGWRDWQSEKTVLGSVVKNTVGYAIIMSGNKFRVYNPAKAMVGIYTDLEQAKKRVQRDEPR